MYVPVFLGLYLLDLLILEHRHKSPLTRNQHKLLKQTFPPRAKTKRKKEYNPKRKGDLKWSKLEKKKKKYREIQYK